MTPRAALPLDGAMLERLSGVPLLMLLDVDGTLSPIAPRPEYAIVPGATQRVLNELVATPHVFVAVVSGRGADDARRLICVEGAWVIGNHGIEVAAPNQPPAVREDVARYGDAISEAARRACVFAASTHGVLVEDKRWTLSVHYRLAHPQIVGELTARVNAIADELGLVVTHGKEVLELRPPVSIDKGSAAVELARTLGADGAAASLFCAGDDRTDEDMFREVRAHQPRAVTVRVGVMSSDQVTGAEFSVDDTDAMRELLQSILTRRRELSASPSWPAS
jgi:trehalose-phosphatase